MTARAWSWTSIALVAALAVGVAAPAHADLELATPSVSVPPGYLARCRIANLNPRPLRVGIELWDVDGQRVFHEDFVVQPRAIGTAGWFAIGALNGYCVFTGNFSKASVRASAEVYQLFGETASVAVAPAE